MLILCLFPPTLSS